jgi:hypothetical protein
MKFKKIALTALLLTLGVAALVVPKANTSTGQITTKMEAAEPGSIEEMAQTAAANGQSYVGVPLLAQHEDVNGFEEAKTHYSVLVARADSRQTLQTSPFNVATWYRFTVTEVLSSKAPFVCVNGRCTPPAGVAGPGATEMLLPKAGGSVVSNGVTVEVALQDFPDFTLGQSYLLFIDYDASARLGAPILGAIGVFSVNASGGLAALSPEPNDLKTDIANLYGNSLSQVRAALGAPTTGCNTLQEQQCYNGGGSWDPSTCQCFYEPDPDPGDCPIRWKCSPDIYNQY